MKPTSSAIGALLLAALSFADKARAEFTVHEWGTLTTLSDASGNPVRWYLPVPDQAELPAFVYPGWLMQAGALKGSGPDGLAVTRMETPVLYFYPDEEMNIMVTASLADGKLTDWFPNALRSNGVPAAAPVLDSSLLAPKQLQWMGRLVPPSSPLASTIPGTDDAAGRRYAAARAVPDAWIFQSGLPKGELRLHFDWDAKPEPKVIPMPPFAEVDRLIFYRGASDRGGPLHVFTGDDRVFNLRNHGEKIIPACFAVQPSSQGIAWTRVDGLQPSKWEEQRWTNAKDFTFPPPVPRDEAVAGLRKAVTETLVTEGLTPAEAAAMVATWQDLWFGETGTRVLTVLPEEWVRELVPLTITPAPAKLDRVYVLRSEILTKARRETVAELITRTGDPAADAARLKALELGRFARGALASANHLVTQRTEARFNTLQATK
jgi:hypothetical protein